MTSPSKTLVAGSAAFLLVAGAVGAQQMRIQRLERLLRVAPESPAKSTGVSSGEFGYYVDQLSKRIDDVGRVAQDAAQGPLFEREMLAQATGEYYFTHFSKRLAARTEFLRPTGSFFLDRFSLPNSLLDAYDDRNVSFGTGLNGRGDRIPENEHDAFTLSFHKARNAWPPEFSFMQSEGFSVEVRALGLDTSVPYPAPECPPGTDPVIVALIPHVRSYVSGELTDAELCTAIEPFTTANGIGDNVRLFTLPGQVNRGSWLPTVLFAHSTIGWKPVAIQVRASLGNEHRDPMPEEAEQSLRAHAKREHEILADLAKNISFSGCEYACAY